jgi:hypothetical protein
MDNELMKLSDIFREASHVSTENTNLRKKVDELERRLLEDKWIKENKNLKDEVNRLRLSHKEMKEKLGNEKHRADMLEVALNRKNLEMEVSNKEHLKTILLSELKKHINLIRGVYGPNVDACEKLVNLVHQSMSSSLK